MVGVEGADVEAAGGHGPGVHGGVADHVMGEVAGCILATAVVYRVAHEVEVALLIYIEGWHGPVTLGHLGFLLHADHAVVGVELHHAGALQFLDRRLFVTHDAAGALRLGVVDELTEGEEEQVVGRHHEQVVVDVELVHGEEQVADGPQSGVVGLCAVVDDRDGFGIVCRRLPLVEDGGEAVVRDDDMFGDVVDGVDIVEHPAEDRVVADLQQWFWEILGELP